MARCPREETREELSWRGASPVHTAGRARPPGGSVEHRGFRTLRKNPTGQVRGEGDPRKRSW